MAAWIWVLIPIVALLVGGFTEWLKFKAKQQRLGSSTSELEKTVVAQQQALGAALQRIQNLEAIVTSQMWDVVHDNALPEADRQRALAQSRRYLDSPEDETSDAERAARLARRLKA